jgi:ankyrin repeat protein
MNGIRRFFTPYFIFLLLMCGAIHGMDESKKLITLPGSCINLPKELIDSIEKHAGLISSYNLANTCKYYRKTINPNKDWLKKYSDVVKNMDVNSYTKDMIFCARSDNEYMFFWLKENTNEKNCEETQYLFDYIYGPSDMDKKERKLAIYKTSKYVKKKVQEFTFYPDNEILQSIRLLVHQGFNVNYQWKDGNTLLHFLTHGLNKNRYDAIMFLLGQSEININIQNNEGRTALHATICEAKFENWCEKRWYKERMYDQSICMEKLLKHPEILINLQDNDGNTALHIAVLYKNNAQIKHLIQRPDIDFNVQNNDGNTVLHYPVFYKYINLIPNFSANINSKNKQGNTPLHMAETFEQSRYLLERDDIDVNIKNNKGETPLHFSIKHPYMTKNFSWQQSFELWSDRRVNKTIVTNKGKTFWHYVAKYVDDWEDLDYFMEDENINFQSVDYQGRTFLHMAAKYYNDRAVKKLLRRPKMSREIVNWKDNNNFSALDYAFTVLKKNKDKEKWKIGGVLVSRTHEKTGKLLRASKKVDVPFLFFYRRMVFFCGFLVGLVGLSLFVLFNCAYGIKVI